MSRERELIKDMKILLECTYMGGLQRNADVLIGRAIEILAQPEREPLSVGCIQNGLSSEEVPDYKAMTFIKGIRFAEKQHNIGVENDE